MRISQYLLATLKKIPKNCEIISHQLMLRAGLIRQVSSGLYTWLPTGLRVLTKIKNIIREEMNKIGALEISMPIVQPATLWKQSGRWTEYGSELLRFKNRNDQDFILSPTHEEMISKLITTEIISCNKQFPLNLYQINTKYRDEARPQFGIIRSREFIMKDGYSFHTNQKSLQTTYDKMYDTYFTIFKRIALNFRIIQADPGKIGGILSHEFQAYSKCEEKNYIISTNKYNNNINNTNKILKSQNLIPIKKKSSIFTETMRLIDAPHIHSVTELINKFNLPIQKIVKTIIIRTAKKNNNIHYSHNFLGLVIRGDHQLSQKKAAMILQLSVPLSFASVKEMYNLTGEIQPNFLGPINLDIPLIIDHNVATMRNFIAGSNINGRYLFGINWNQNISLPQVADLHEVINYDHYHQYLNISKIPSNKFIEIGHIFQLGERYSNIILNNDHYYSILKNNKKNLTLTMGCYGIGITRIVAVIIEQNHDKNGILWPDSIAPFKLAIIPINMHNSIDVRNIAEKIYNQLSSSIIGIDILIDDRKEHPGKMFADIDLIGVPHILIISDRNLSNQEVEYKYRKTGTVTKIKLDLLSQFLTKILFVQ